MKRTTTPIGPTREIRAPGYDCVAVGDLGCFTLTPTSYGFEDRKFNYETGELRDWKGRIVACVNLDQRDEDTRYRDKLH
jgi:hypothetical protein